MFLTDENSSASCSNVHYILPILQRGALLISRYSSILFASYQHCCLWAMASPGQLIWDWEPEIKDRNLSLQSDTNPEIGILKDGALPILVVVGKPEWA